MEAPARRTHDKSTQGTAKSSERQSAISFANNANDVPQPTGRGSHEVLKHGTDKYATSQPAKGIHVEFIPVSYDHERLAAEMRSEGLPCEFADTILSGHWTTCLEILPGKERRRGRF